jgi:hypothetical protein
MAGFLVKPLVTEVTETRRYCLYRQISVVEVIFHTGMIMLSCMYNICVYLVVLIPVVCFFIVIKVLYHELPVYTIHTI